MKNYKKEIIRLRKEGKLFKEIVNELGCAKSTVSYHCSMAGLGRVDIIEMPEKNIKALNLYYKNHTRKETAEYFNISTASVKKYGFKQKTKTTLKQRKANVVIAVQKRRAKVKQMSLNYKGNKCSKCGYDTCTAALEFHHIDPKNKEFSISAKGYTRSWDKVKEELDKCELVCANCHRELHANI